MKQKIKASDFFNVFDKTPQILENISIHDESILKKPIVKKAIKYSNKLIKDHGRILVRKSGTEPKIRVMGESDNKILLKKCINIIIKKIK